MSSRTIKWLVGLFVLLLIAALYPQWAPILHLNKQQISATQPDFSSPDPAKVNRITITEDGSGHVLTFTDTGWEVDGKTASGTRVEELLSAIAGTTIQSLVSHNPDSFATYGIDPQNGTKLTLEAGDQKVTYLLGNFAPGSAFYLNVEGTSEVYLVTALLRLSIMEALQPWSPPVASGATMEMSTDGEGQ